MHIFSRIVFAVAGLMLGLLVGTAAAALIAVLLLRNSDGGPGDGIAILFLAMLGAGLGAVVGLGAGLIVPAVCEQRQIRRKEKEAFAAPDERVWPPPPGQTAPSPRL